MLKSTGLFAVILSILLMPIARGATMQQRIDKYRSQDGVAQEVAQCMVATEERIGKSQAFSRLNFIDVDNGDSPSYKTAIVTRQDDRFSLDKPVSVSVIVSLKATAMPRKPPYVWHKMAVRCGLNKDRVIALEYVDGGEVVPDVATN